MSTILEVKDLKKYFKVNAGLLHAVDGVSFKIEEGQTLGVVGESVGSSTKRWASSYHLGMPWRMA